MQFGVNVHAVTSRQDFQQLVRAAEDPGYDLFAAISCDFRTGISVPVGVKVTRLLETFMRRIVLVSLEVSIADTESPSSVGNGLKIIGPSCQQLRLQIRRPDSLRGSAETMPQARGHCASSRATQPVPAALSRRSVTGCHVTNSSQVGSAAIHFSSAHRSHSTA